ncbi:hypothetical protein AVEN_105040-1, partial [Araneus ventricosus]
LDDIRSDSEDGDTLPHLDESRSDFSVDEAPQPFSQSELNDLVRGLGLSKDGPELLGSRLKNKNLLTSGTLFFWYRHREKEFIQFFSKEENLVFCNDVQGLKKCFDIECDPSEWHLFIDSSKTSLKAIFPSSKMSSAIERPFIETRSHNDWPMNGFLSDRDEFSSGIAPKCLIGHRSADHRYRMSFASRYDRKP